VDFSTKRLFPRSFAHEYCHRADFTKVVNNLRYERYPSNSRHTLDGITRSSTTRRVYYFLRPFLPVPVRKHLQRARLSGWGKNHISPLAGRLHGGVVNGARPGSWTEEPGNDERPLYLVLAERCSKLCDRDPRCRERDGARFLWRADEFGRFVCHQIGFLDRTRSEI